MFDRFKRTPQAVIALLVAPLVLGVSVLGCTPQQQENAKAAVAKVIAYEPEVTGAVDTVAQVVSTFVPADALLITSSQTIFDQAMAELDVAAKAYIATPNAGTLASVNSVLQTLLTTNAAQFLAAAHISNPASVAMAKTAISGVRVILLLMDSLLAPQLSTSTVTADNAAQPIHLRDIEPYVDAQSKHRVEVATGHSYGHVYGFATAEGL